MRRIHNLSTSQVLPLDDTIEGITCNLFDTYLKWGGSEPESKSCVPELEVPGRFAVPFCFCESLPTLPKHPPAQQAKAAARMQNQ